MKKVKYYYNPSTLRFEKIERSAGNIALRIFAFLCAASVFGALVVVIVMTSLDSPKERFLRNEIGSLKLEYDLMSQELDTLNYILESLQERDNNIYRVIFEAEPLAHNIRMAPIGGSERHTRLNKLENGEIIKGNLEDIEMLKRRLVSQSRSYDEISRMITEKEELLARIPAIQPVSNEELKRIASGFGMRIHPIYKTRKMHEGIDFTAPTGSNVYATGDGVVVRAERGRGYGNIIEIAHGHGYRTRYAHLSKFDCRAGQRVSRGERIGFVGSTGLSSGPHLHYEVLREITDDQGNKSWKKVDPINYFFHDLTDEEFDKVIELANKSNQSFD
jgi:hypothetical protein